MYGTGLPQEVGNGGQVYGDVEAVRFHVQNVYKMTYCGENVTFEPLNPWTLNLSYIHFTQRKYYGKFTKKEGTGEIYL